MHCPISGNSPFLFQAYYTRGSKVTYVPSMGDLATDALWREILESISGESVIRLGTISRTCGTDTLIIDIIIYHTLIIDKAHLNTI